MSNVIDLKGISWRRDEKTILRDVNWQVAKGQHWAVLGLNGSGKTTILNMINGYIWPTTGTVSVLGHEFGTIDLRELRRSIGWVSSSLQEKMHYNDLTDNVVISGKYASIGLYEKPTAQDYEQAHQLMRDLGCGHLIGGYYRTCSQGEKQKILIARALMASPRLLILDEACNGLDFISREALLSSISEIASRPDAPTLLYVTHHTEEISHVFTHTLLVRRGTIFSVGETKEVVTSEALSEFFETPVHISWQKERAWLSVP